MMSLIQDHVILGKHYYSYLARAIVKNVNIRLGKRPLQKIRNFTEFPRAEILWKGTVSAYLLYERLGKI